MFDQAIKQLRLEDPDTRIVWLMCAALRDEHSRITYSAVQLAELTGLHRSDVTIALDRLAQLGLLTPLLAQGTVTGWHVACSASKELVLASELAASASSDPEVSSSRDPTRGVRKGEVRRGEPQTFPVNSPDSLMRLWNATVTVLPKVSGLNASRRRHAIARITEYRDCDWAAVIQRLDASPFCRGDNSRGWRANFDFFLRPTTIAKTIEGVYDPPPTLPISSRNLAASEAWLAARRRARGEHDGA
jgi:hypothetical protein